MSNFKKYLRESLNRLYEEMTPSLGPLTPMPIIDANLESGLCDGILETIEMWEEIRVDFCMRWCTSYEKYTKTCRENTQC